MATWNNAKVKECKLVAAGTKAMGTTLDNAAAAAVAGSSNLVRLPSTAHGFKAGSMLEILDTTNYDAALALPAVAANTFDIYGTYVAETFGGGETVRVVLSSGFPFELLEVKLHITGTVPATAENFTITRDAADGSYWDELIRSQAMAGITTDIWNIRDTPLRYNPNDKLIFAWANTDGRTWGLEIVYGRLGG